jgi:hypothetical protein
MTQEQGGTGGGSMTQAELKALFLQQQQQRSGVTLTEWPSQLPRESFVRYYLLSEGLHY